ncbi:hypothetical protein GCM10022198_16100 [Klugiella xanthotipulae]|uniref:Uncharacterized protein n=1 Tax=Klugiella xanthotipulae TaxID=244735 RepID=A0A543HH41_9MICO|nr:hypothetical protein [Klugiella xanthotipulae]TQM57648.1 hypothetical protein FB466_2643 [Klugiella xanthotipulae]
MIDTESIPHLRRNARLERAALIEHHAREGEDPAEFMAVMPSVDELVVATLLDDELHGRGLAAEHGLARLAGMSTVSDAAEHRRNAEAVERRLLHEIPREHPELSTAVWYLLGRLGTP